MKLLKEMYDDVTRVITWSLNETEKTAEFRDMDNVIRSVSFCFNENLSWDVVIDDIDTKYLSTYSSIFNSFAQMNEEYEVFQLNIKYPSTVSNGRIYESCPLAESINYIVKSVTCIYDYMVMLESTDPETKLAGISLFRANSDEELLTEEPNTSLMYHKLFPNKKILRDLEGCGYTFQMGSGLKIYKKFYASTHRGSGPSSRRTLQSIVILKDGKMFRKIPKSKWVQLVDSSDRDSVTWGTMFMRKMLKAESDRINARRTKLLQKKKERLEKSKKPS